MYVFQHQVHRGTPSIRLPISVWEHRYLLDSLLAKLLSMLDEHPHDALDLTSAKQSSSGWGVQAKRRLLLPCR